MHGCYIRGVVAFCEIVSSLTNFWKAIKGAVFALKDGKRLAVVRSVWHRQWKGKRTDHLWGLWKKKGVERSV